MGLGDGQNIQGFSNVGVSLGCIYYLHTRVCSQSGESRHIGTNKLICKANQWSHSCVMWFLPEGCYEQTIILHLYGSCKRGYYARVAVLSCTWGVEDFLEFSDVAGHRRFGVCFHSGTNEVK